MQHNFHGICKSPLALSLGQPFSSAVAQQYAHDFGLLQHEELSPQTIYSACVYVRGHVDVEEERYGQVTRS